MNKIFTAMAILPVIVFTAQAQAVTYEYTTSGVLTNYWSITLDLPGIDYSDIPAPGVGSTGISSTGMLVMDNLATSGIDFTSSIPELKVWPTHDSMTYLETFNYWQDARGIQHRIGYNTLDTMGNNLYPTSSSYIISSNYQGMWTLVPEASVVPVPAAVWLFGSGLLGLLGVGRIRQH